jgi:hypothetical protein
MLAEILGPFFANHVEAQTNQVLSLDNNEGESPLKEVFESGVLVFRSPELEFFGGSNSLPGQGLWLGGWRGEIPRAITEMRLEMWSNPNSPYNARPRQATIGRAWGIVWEG